MWVSLSDIARESLRYTPSTTREVAQQIELHLLQHIMRPVTNMLEEIATASDETAGSNALEKLRKFATTKDLSNLGNLYTGHLLSAVGVRKPPLQWVLEAHATLENHATSKVDGRRAKTLRARTKDIIAFAAWDVSACQDTPDVQRILLAGRVTEAGRVFIQKDAASVAWNLEEVLVPIMLQVSRDDHAERTVLLEFMKAIMIAEASLDGGTCSSNLRMRWAGVLRLYITHFPCLSCMAVLCQFSRRFPGVQLEIAFDVIGSVHGG